MARAFVSVGSNIRPARNVRAALRRLSQQVRIVGISTVYRTTAEDRPEQPPYFNCVVELEAAWSPTEVKQRVLRVIEDHLGRQRSDDKFAPRTIDLDLILYGDLVLQTPDLALPDPQILRRPFIAHPLYELAPEAILPGFGLRIADVAAALPAGEMEALERFTVLLRRELRRRRD